LDYQDGRVLSSGVPVRDLSDFPFWPTACARLFVSPTSILKPSTPASTPSRTTPYPIACQPKSGQWDLAVSNPPHFIDEYFGNLRAHDPHWGVHVDFFRTVSPFLKPGGVIILQGNNAGSTEETFRSKIEDAGLDIVFTRGDLPFRTRNRQYYFIGIMLAGGFHAVRTSNPTRKS
jgi:hypothetical protein